MNPPVPAAGPTTSPAQVRVLPATAETPAVRRLRWWHEVLFILGFYAIYSIIRNMQGSASVSAEVALRNAFDVIHLERLLGLYHEETFQEIFINWRPFIVFWNLFYGTFHFVVTAFVLVFLFRRFPVRYRRWRNVLAATTALALVGFALYPLMPPRLLPPRFGFVDTLRAYGSLWSFDSTAMHKISNQYAAMPSLHFAWATWCACALLPVVKRPVFRVLTVLYPVLTLIAIVITGNHFVIDAVAGLAVLWAGWLIAVGGERTVARLRRRRLQVVPAQT